MGGRSEEPPGLLALQRSADRPVTPLEAWKEADGFLTVPSHHSVTLFAMASWWKGASCFQRSQSMCLFSLLIASGMFYLLILLSSVYNWRKTVPPNQLTQYELHAEQRVWQKEWHFDTRAQVFFGDEDNTQSIDSDNCRAKYGWIALVNLQVLNSRESHCYNRWDRPASVLSLERIWTWRTSLVAEKSVSQSMIFSSLGLH